MKNRIEVTPAHTAGLPCTHEAEVAVLRAEVAQLRIELDSAVALFVYLSPVEPTEAERLRGQMARTAALAVDAHVRLDCLGAQRIPPRPETAGRGPALRVIDGGAR